MTDRDRALLRDTVARAPAVTLAECQSILRAQAKRRGMDFVTITDHDTIAGLPEATDEAKRLGVDFLPGIEISCEFPAPGTMHILGYGVDPGSETLRDLTRRLLEGRDNRNPRIIEKLNELGVALSVLQLETDGARRAAEKLAELIQHAKSKKLRVILMPIVLLDKPEGNEWRGTIKPPDWDGGR